eukprot:GHVL01035605.1.p1 GENE.GHVL01035605.1~~GHVL01035605.1.p1  ORF type:complete len:460 (+),score=57.90 GHVL01035605.1:15-1394(+)
MIGQLRPSCLKQPWTQVREFSKYHIPKISNMRVALRKARYVYQGGRRISRRWSSMTQTRVRQYRVNVPVVVTTDLSLMDCLYLTACVQKAASLRMHDLDLWRRYADRCRELAPDFDAFQLSIILYGWGKSKCPHLDLYSNLIPYIKAKLDDFSSHGLMLILWSLDRANFRDLSLVSAVGEMVLLKFDKIRPKDLLKIVNCYAKFGLREPQFCDPLNKHVIQKFEKTFAQEFRGVMEDVSLAYVYSSDVQKYILERYPRIHKTLRPHHAQKAFQSIVAVRALHPRTWAELSITAKTFYIKLTCRYINWHAREPSLFHWQISDVLAKLNVAHRNTFKWGCFWIDIGESDDSRNVIQVDGPTSFYTGTNEYRAVVKLHHRILSEFGWNIRRIRWYDWLKLESNLSRQIAFLTNLRNSDAESEILSNPSEVLTKEEYLSAKVKLNIHKSPTRHNKKIEYIKMF